MKNLKKSDLVVCIRSDFEKHWYDRLKIIKFPVVGNVYTVLSVSSDGRFLELLELLNHTHFRTEFPFISKNETTETWIATSFEKIIYDECAIKEVVSEEINQVS